MNKIAITAIILATAAIIIGFWVVGSPQKQRQEKIDQARTSDLQNITWAIQEYWNKKEALPAVLDDLIGQTGFYLEKNNLEDPETEEKYNYEKISGETFRLCANFFTDNIGESKDGLRSIDYSYPYSNWRHYSGEYCFKFKVGESLINKPRQIVPISL